MKSLPFSEEDEQILEALSSKNAKMEYEPGAVLDDRDSDNPEFVVDEELSSTNTGFGGCDPAAESAL